MASLMATCRVRRGPHSDERAGGGDSGREDARPMRSACNGGGVARRAVLCLQQEEKASCVLWRL